MSRPDAVAKASGAARYVADVALAGLAHAAVTRSEAAHARIVSIDSSVARSMPGVIGVYTAADLCRATYGRRVRDVPILARDKVRYVGEGVAAVLAETRKQAEAAAAMVFVDYEELERVVTPEEALAPGAPLVHEAPWDYPSACITAEHGPNLQSHVEIGSQAETVSALGRARHVIERVYSTPSGHQGYLEPQACVADIGHDGKIRLFVTNKSPYNLRRQIGACLGIGEDEVEVQPVPLGGDFGGKGSPGPSLLCIELARRSGRPVKLVLRYGEDLLTTNPRHPSVSTVRIGCDESGNLVALSLDVLLNGGAYAGFKPSPQAILHGPVHDLGGYRIPHLFTRCRIAYTNTVPRGHMRAPGSPQTVFAVESALDELAEVAGIAPAEMRRRNLLTTGEADAYGHSWVERRGRETLDAALAALVPRPAPEGWLSGWGLACYQRETATNVSTSLRLVPLDGGRVRVEVGMYETGAGSHEVAQKLFARALGLGPEDVEVRQVPTDLLPKDPGAGGSRVTANLALAADAAAKAWSNDGGERPLLVEVDETPKHPLGSSVVQIAQVAVDPESGQLEVLEILTAVDVAEIVNPKAFQMQLDGGTAMGYGFACLEDLYESEGQIWAANLGEFKLPSSRDVPAYQTVLVPGGRGVGAANVKNVGELTTPPTAAAIANAVAAATGRRIRTVPITAERIFEALAAKSASGDPS